MERERRYPATPYPPRSKATKQYRDAQDLGWRHFGSLRSQVLGYEAGLSGPRRHGYRDGVIARWEAEQRARSYEAESRRAALDQQRAQWRNQAESEGAW